MKWVLGWVERCVSKKYHNDKYVQLRIPVLRELVVASSTVLMAPCLKFEELFEVHSIIISHVEMSSMTVHGSWARNCPHTCISYLEKGAR